VKFIKVPGLFILIALLVASCSSGKLITVSKPQENASSELIYRRKERPENLVMEIRYYPNGDTLSVTPLQRGTVHGTVRSFFPNNVIKEEVEFVNGEQHGGFRRYDNEGTLILEGELVNGKKTGTWTTWYDEVQKLEQRTYIDDRPDGKWTYWYIDGSLKREETYRNGALIEAKDF